MLDWNWAVAAAALAVATVLVISAILIFLRPNHRRINIVSTRKPFHWIDHPDRSADAINRGWAAFSFSNATQSAELEHSSYSGNVRSDTNSHRLSLRPSSIARKGETEKNRNGNKIEDVPSPSPPAIHDLKTVLPLPGPPFSGFPQEAYLEIAFFPINNKSNDNNSNNNKIINNNNDIDNNKIIVNNKTINIDNGKIIANNKTNNISNSKITINNSANNIDNSKIIVNNNNITNNKITNNKITNNNINENNIGNIDSHKINNNTGTDTNNNHLHRCTPCIDANIDIDIGVKVASTFSSFSEGERAKLIADPLALPSERYNIDDRRNSVGSHVVAVRPASESGRKSCSARVQHSAEGLDECSRKARSDKHVDQSVLPPPIIAVGFTSIDATTFRLPGTYPGSIGFHSDGHIYLHGVEYMGEPSPNVSFVGKRWPSLTSTTTIVVGMGFDPKWKKVFFTLNGEHVCEVITGSGDEDFGGALYPTIASNLEANVSVNFGQTPFEYTPCNTHRINDPSSSRVVNIEDSGDLFSMGRLDSQYLNYINGLDFSNEDLDSDLFEIILDGKQP